MKGKNTKKRIATIIWKDGIGGAERSLTDLASALDRDQFDMRFYYLSGEPAHFAEKIQQLGFKTEFLNWKNGHDIGGRIRLIKSLKRYNPHLIHDHILPLLTRPFIKLFLGCPILYTEHGVACKRAIQSHKYSFMKALERFDLLFCKYILANSKASAVALQSVYNIPASKIKVILLGINLANFIPTRKSQPLLTIGFLGRITNEQKGVDRLPEIAKLLHEQNMTFKMLIAGNGPDRMATEKKCTTLRVDEYVDFLGWITNVKSFFSKISVLVIPSRYEPLGLIAIEALAMEVPVVAFKTGGLTEVLLDCPNGFLVPQGDIECMVNSILTANKTSQGVRSKGREYIHALFSNQIMAKKYFNIYLKTINDINQ